VEIDLPQVKSNIEECKKALSAYAKLPKADSNIIDDAFAAWTSAHEWTEEVMSQFRKQKLIFDQQQPIREVNFKPCSESLSPIFTDTVK
jgi:hypothetical protein